MEKPDRDFTHAKRAEDAYRQMILEYPDSKLLPQAKERLRQVQEVLAEREFRIGRFYYLRESYPAAIARLKAVADTYPLYSGAEEALYMIGDSYEGEIRLIRDNKFLPEAKKGQLIKEWTDGAADAYSRIITRYPVTGRADDAKKRLAELKRPIPTPTPQAIAENKAEEASREKLGLWSRTMLNFHKRPDVAEATRVGEPTLVDPKTPDAPAMTRHVAEVVTGQPAGSLSVEKGTGVPGPNQPVPRSDQAAPADQSAPPAQTGSAAANSSATSAGSAQAGTSTSSVSVQGTANTDQSPAATGIGELTPMTSAPGTTATQTTPPQANPAAADSTNSTQAVTGETGTPAPGATESAPTAPAAGQNNAAPAAGSTNGAPATASPDQNGSAPAPPPAQVNDINSGSSSSTATAADTASQSTDKDKSDKDKKESSSKKKKKKFGVF
jgi:outer membrane protein assembly factor BamD